MSQPFIHIPALRNIVEQHWAKNAKLDEVCRSQDIDAGKVISYARQPLADAYRIESGMVQVSDHHDVDIARRGIVLGPGDWYGLYALAPPHPGNPDERALGLQFPSGLRALTKTRVHRLPVDQYPAAIRRVDEAIKKDPALLGSNLGDDVFKKAVEAEIRLNQFLPRLLDALRRHAHLRAIPTYQLVDLAQAGELVEIEKDDPQGWADTGARHWFFVAQNSVVLASDKQSGVRLWEGSVVEGFGHGMWIKASSERKPRLVAIPTERIAQACRGVLELRPDLPAVAQTGSRGARKRGILVTKVGKCAVSVSAIAARLAETLQLDLPKSRAAANDVRLVILKHGGGASEGTGSRGLKISTVDVSAPDWKNRLDAAMDDTRHLNAPVVFDTAALSNGQISSLLADRVGKIAMLAADSFADLPSDLTFPPRTTTVRAVMVGDAETGEYLAYHPRTVRLAFDQPDRLDRTPLEMLTDRDQAALGRLGRAVTERRIGLALGGGGAWGFAHIALIQELQRVHVPIDMVSGVSFGSVVGAFFAVGGQDALRNMMENRLWLQVSLGVSSALPQAAPLFLERLWKSHRKQTTNGNGGRNGKPADGETLERLEMPFYPVSLNLETGEEWSPSLGKLGRGVRAASALAGMFTPVIDNGIRAVDGVFVNNVPEAVLTREGADFIIASDVTQTPPPEPDKKPRLLASLKDAVWPFERMKDNMRAVGFLVKIANERDQAYAHATFRPRLGGYSMWQFHRGEDMVRMVREDASQFARDVKKQWDTLDWQPV